MLLPERLYGRLKENVGALTDVNNIANGFLGYYHSLYDKGLWAMLKVNEFSFYLHTSPDFSSKTPNQILEMTDVPTQAAYGPASTRGGALTEPPQGVRYTAQWLYGEPVVTSQVRGIQPDNSDAVFSRGRPQNLPLPSGFLLDIAYGAAVLKRYGNVLDEDTEPSDTLKLFPRFLPMPPIPRRDPTYYPEGRQPRSASPDTPVASRANSDDSSGGSLTDSDEVPEEDMWGPFLTVLSLFRKAAPPEESAVDRWRKGCDDDEGRGDIANGIVGSEGLNVM